MTLTLAETKHQLARTPGMLCGLVGALPDPWLEVTEGPGTWSPIRVLRHMSWCEIDDWIPRARLILEHQDRVAFTPFDRDGGEARYAGWTGAAMLDEFARLRAANLQTLDDLQVGDRHMDLPGTHPQLGPVTMRQLLSTWVCHDFAHMTQISRTLARQYRDAVGPWREFLSVLKAEG